MEDKGLYRRVQNIESKYSKLYNKIIQIPSSAWVIDSSSIIASQVLSNVSMDDIKVTSNITIDNTTENISVISSYIDHGTFVVDVILTSVDIVVETNNTLTVTLNYKSDTTTKPTSTLSMELVIQS